jgi:hypothetical protein
LSVKGDSIEFSRMVCKRQAVRYGVFDIASRYHTMNDFSLG